MTSINDASNSMKSVLGKLQTVVIEQPEMCQTAVISVVIGGNFIVNGEPGTGKTLLNKALAKAANMEFGRVQLNPDVTPTDFTGGLIWNPKTGELELKPGPLLRFPFLLVDEFDRGSRQIHSAIIEATAERTVSIDGTSYPTPENAVINATMNGIDHDDSVRRVPRAVMDRFWLSCTALRPSAKAEALIADMDDEPNLEQLLNGSYLDLKLLREQVREVRLATQYTTDDQNIDIKLEAIKMVRRTIPAATGKDAKLTYDAGIRASRILLRAAAALALLNGKATFDLDDIRTMAVPVLRHRIDTVDLMSSADKDNYIKELIK